MFRVLGVLATPLISIFSFFVFMGIMSRLIGNDDIAAGAAALLGFIGTPIVLLHLLSSPTTERVVPIIFISMVSSFVLAGTVARLTGNDDVIGYVSMLLGLVGTPIVLLYVWRSPNPSSKYPDGSGLIPESLFVVKVNESRITVQHPNGQVQVLPISQLQEVMIVTTDTGPIGMDVWWVLSGGAYTPGCMFPGGATGEQEVLQFVLKLPGFNNERFLQAMGSTSNAKFICWSASALTAHRSIHHQPSDRNRDPA